VKAGAKNKRWSIRSTAALRDSPPIRDKADWVSTAFHAEIAERGAEFAEKSFDRVSVLTRFGLFVAITLLGSIRRSGDASIFA
jgi:hypothetical protein